MCVCVWENVWRERLRQEGAGVRWDGYIKKGIYFGQLFLCASFRFVCLPILVAGGGVLFVVHWLIVFPLGYYREWREFFKEYLMQVMHSGSVKDYWVVFHASLSIMSRLRFFNNSQFSVMRLSYKIEITLERSQGFTVVEVYYYQWLAVINTRMWFRWHRRYVSAFVVWLTVGGRTNSCGKRRLCSLWNIIMCVLFVFTEQM